MNIVGHRGASVAERENTPAAFVAADRMGADGVELDVRLAPDGRAGTRLVVCHDPLPAEQNAVDALPGFNEVLRACGTRMLVNVEIKNSAEDGGFDPSMAVVAPTIAAMRVHDDTPGRWLISSFSLPTIDHVRLLAPEIATAFLCYALDAATIATAIEGGHAAVHPWAPGVDREGVEAAHAVGLIVNTWTVNDPEQIAELEAKGVDGVCTDVPDVARLALARDTDPVDASPSWGISPVGGGTPA